MDFKLIVFDWDGTLMDSEAKIVASIQAAFTDMGKQPPSHEAARDIIGISLADAMVRLWPEADDTQRSRVTDRYRFHYHDGGADGPPSPLFPGAQELVDWLLQRDYLLAVATGKSRWGFDPILGDTGLADRFHATRCADEACSKPHPEMLLQIMDELGVTGAETLMVGDTEYDMQMARNAGTSALAVCYGVHERGRLLAQRPLDCLETLPELRSWFEREEVV
ncbi:HAD-IA family hydrolase [Candidatus Thiosymbion oneisti]|uniref:HAD-IA family hydrolase n=1 Tax=Candidatus Thiosymbion oneisti TaxID=589554 RepID=UPI000A806A5A|nr:HAD-IA family hydrolase [Candidatus Thiosymbion oneisti]